MSSTNRGAGRVGPDYYITPVPSILEFFDALEADWRDVLDTSKFSFDEPLTVLDPCAGGDATHEMSYPVAIKQHPLWRTVEGLFTMDIREDSKAEHVVDYLQVPLADLMPKVAIANPPFNLALQFIKKGLEDVADGGLVIALLRLNFLGSQARAEFFQHTMPVAVYVHSKRMKFSDALGTDSVEYGHFLWQKGNFQKFGRIRVICPTERATRRSVVAS